MHIFCIFDPNLHKMHIWSLFAYFYVKQKIWWTILQFQKNWEKLEFWVSYNLWYFLKKWLSKTDFLKKYFNQKHIYVRNLQKWANFWEFICIFYCIFDQFIMHIFCIFSQFYLHKTDSSGNKAHNSRKNQIIFLEISKYKESYYIFSLLIICMWW